MNDVKSQHPVSARLDAFAVGHHDDETAAHVQSCASCARYVEVIARGTESFAGEAQAARFVLGVRARDRNRAARTRWKSWATGAASALALAAGVFFFVRIRSGVEDGVAPAIVAPEPGPTRFKGGKGSVQVAVVVEHAGAQSRQTGPLELEPGDRIRLEIALGHDEHVAAGVLADDGEWAELQPPTSMAAGTTYSAQSIQFDDDLPKGVILVGTADAVNAARKSRNFVDVVAVPLGRKTR